MEDSEKTSTLNQHEQSSHELTETKAEFKGPTLPVCTRSSAYVLWLPDQDLFYFFILHVNPSSFFLPSFCSPHLSHPLLRGVKPPLENQQSLASKLTQDQLTPVSRLRKVYHHREWPPKSQFIHLRLVLVQLSVPPSQQSSHITVTHIWMAQYSYGNPKYGNK